jgi:hypothetical protein
MPDDDSRCGRRHRSQTLRWPTVRTLLLIMTVVGGLLSLTAAGWVGWLAWRARWRQRNLARLGDLYVEELKRHSRAYQDYGNRLAEHEAGRSPRPVPPFGGMDQKAHEDQVHAEHFERLRKRTGREPLQPGTDREVGGEVLAELIGPAVVGGVGIVLSTVAGAWSLYLPPNL